MVGTDQRLNGARLRYDIITSENRNNIVSYSGKNKSINTNDDARIGSGMDMTVVLGQATNLIIYSFERITHEEHRTISVF